MAGHFQHKVLQVFSNRIRKFAEEDFKPGEFHINEAELYRPMMYIPEDQPGTFVANKCVTAMLQSWLIRDTAPNPVAGKADIVHYKPDTEITDALLAAGVPRRWGAFYCVNPGAVVEELDRLVNTLTDAPSEVDERTVFDSLIDTLQAIMMINRPARPAKIHFKRWQAFQVCRSHQGVVEQELARTKKTITYQAVQHSVALVDDYYLSINPSGHIASKPRNRTSTVIVDPQIMAENTLGHEPIPGE